MSDIILTDALGTPKIQPRNAQMSTKIYFWFNKNTDHIMQGAPPQFDAMRPPGYQTITCNHASEAEMWSARLNAQDKRHAEMNDIEREFFEGKIRADLRKETVELMANPPMYLDEAHKRVRGELLQRALDELDESEKRVKTKRESFLHVEAFEHGH